MPLLTDKQQQALIDWAKEPDPSREPPRWWGIGTETQEADFPGYRRREISLTDAITFYDLPPGITHLQVWDAEQGGNMWFTSALRSPPQESDDLCVLPSVLAGTGLDAWLRQWMDNKQERN